MFSVTSVADYFLTNTTNTNAKAAKAITKDSNCIDLAISFIFFLLKAGRVLVIRCHSPQYIYSFANKLRLLDLETFEQMECFQTK